MSRPSMFSKDYDKKMRARRKRKVLIATILIIGVIVFLFGVSFKKWMKNYSKTQNNIEANKNQPTKKSDDKKKADNTSNNTSSNNQSDNTKNSNTASDEKTISQQLPDGENISVVYTESNGTKKIEHIFLANNQDIYFNINPTGDKAVVLTASQDMYIVDLNGTVTDITKDRYITSKTQETIMKKDYLAANSGFSWHESPKFINDTTIIYVTQMPWFQADKYIYKVDINTKDHQWLSGIQGKQITLNNLVEAGLEVNIDGNNKHINAQGSLVD